MVIVRGVFSDPKMNDILQRDTRKNGLICLRNLRSRRLHLQKIGVIWLLVTGRLKPGTMPRSGLGFACLAYIPPHAHTSLSSAFSSCLL